MIRPILLTAALAGCAAELPPEAFADGRPDLQPTAFFAGATRSSGVLEDRGGAPTQRFHVHGTGASLPDGSFRLDQTIAFDGKPPETRTWLLRQTDAHHYTGTLTDASGPITGEAYGNLFHLRYPMRHPFAGEMEQWLYLQPDGRTLVNEATIRVLGIVAAHLSERISRDAN